MKDTFYFSHDYSARQDDKIKKLIYVHKFEGYGIFWAIVEDLYQNEGKMPREYERIAFELRTETNLVRSVIEDFGLFKFDEKYFWSASVLRRLHIRNQKSLMAKKSAQARWKQPKRDNANALPTQCKGNAIKERKGKENKVNNITPPTPPGEHVEEIKYSDSFLKFWEAYPKKVGKGGAYRSWNRAKKPEISEIIAAVEVQKSSDQWTKENGRFIPNPETWLNQRRWEDEQNTDTSQDFYQKL